MLKLRTTIIFPETILIKIQVTTGLTNVTLQLANENKKIIIEAIYMELYCIIYLSL